MQTIWNRVAQSRCTCKCSSCLTSTAAVARRTTTAAAGRPLRFRDVFTVFYSSILATAAVADSHRKDVRREAWDRAIREAKDELKALENQQQSRLAALSSTSVVDSSSAENDGDSWGGVFRWAVRERESRRALGFDDWKGIPLSVLEQLSKSEIEDTLRDKGILCRLSGEAGSAAWETDSHNQPLSTKKLRTLEWSVAKMTLRFLSKVTNENSCTAETTGVPLNTLVQPSLWNRQELQRKVKQIDERLWLLRQHNQSSNVHESFESPQHPRYFSGPNIDPHDPNSLNAILHATCHAVQREGVLVDSLLAKICYNLLISSTAPNVHTYNLLLTKFCYLREPDLVSAVLTSMRECHIRPNEVTHSATLKFYTLMGNGREFARYVRLMEGLWPGLAVAHPNTKRIPILTGRYRFPNDTVAQFARDKNGAPVPIDYGIDTESSAKRSRVFEKARMNVDVYEKLIHGALRFFGNEQAMQFYRAMIAEGWHPSIKMLTSILRHCYDKGDWPSGIIIWLEIQRLFSEANETVYFWMLRLCRRCRKQSMFIKVLEDSIQCGIYPVEICDLDAEIERGEVKALIKSARLRATNPSQEIQLGASLDLRVGSNPREYRERKAEWSAGNIEPFETVIPAARRSSIHEIQLNKKDGREATYTASASFTRVFDPKPQGRKWSRNAIHREISLDTGPEEVPAIYLGDKNCPPLLPIVQDTQQEAQKISSKMPIVYRMNQEPAIRAHSPHIVPRIEARAGWESFEEPLAVTV